VECQIEKTAVESVSDPLKDETGLLRTVVKGGGVEAANTGEESLVDS